MVKTIKKVCVVLLSFTFLTTVMIELALNASAEPTTPYDFGTWTGSGSVSVNIGIDQAEFVKLTSYEGEEIDRSNYIVKVTEGDTIITLKEEYLKTLTDGEYYFCVDLFSEGLESSEYGMISDTQNEVIIPRPTNSTALVKLTYGDEEIDSTAYIVATIDDTVVLIFQEGYLETLIGEEQEYPFTGYFLAEYFGVNLFLNVDIQPIPTPNVDVTSTPTPNVDQYPYANPAHSVTIEESPRYVLRGLPTDAPSPSQIPRAPKTGNDASMEIWWIVVSLPAACCAFMLTTHRHKKNIT